MKKEEDSWRKRQGQAERGEPPPPRAPPPQGEQQPPPPSGLVSHLEAQLSQVHRALAVVVEGHPHAALFPVGQQRRQLRPGVGGGLPLVIHFSALNTRHKVRAVLRAARRRALGCRLLRLRLLLLLLRWSRSRSRRTPGSLLRCRPLAGVRSDARVKMKCPGVAFRLCGEWPRRDGLRLQEAAALGLGQPCACNLACAAAGRALHVEREGDVVEFDHTCARVTRELETAVRTAHPERP